MVPHVDVCAVTDTASVAEVVALVQERGFSRLPVFHERMFNTIGVVSSLDLLGGMDPHLPVTAVMREPLFVPESKTLPELLWNLPQGDYETLGGLVLERLGRVPKPGDGVQAGRVHIEVTRSSARAVQELRVRERRAPERSG